MISGLAANAAATGGDALAIERATEQDIDAILDLEARGWPAADSMQADRARFRCRIELGGVIVARLGAGGRIVGAISTFRPRWVQAATLDQLLHRCPERLLALPAEQRWDAIRTDHRLPADWHAATDDGRLGGGALHDPAGDVVFGIGITTDPRERRRGIAQDLLHGALAMARGHNARYFLAYSRLPMHSIHAGDTADDYVARTVCEDGVVKPFDFGFRLHWRAGAKPVRGPQGTARYIVIPGSMPEDAESLRRGVLVVTPLDDTSVFPFEAALG